MTLEELRENYNWECVFGEDGNVSDGNCHQLVESADGCPTEPVPTRKDVVEILASQEGENDGDPWVGVFHLADGRYLYAEGWCDYTGWD